MFLSIMLTALIVRAAAFHDSLNFIVAPRAKQCFYEDFSDSGIVQTIDIFVQSGGKNAIEMEVRVVLATSALAEHYIISGIVRQISGPLTVDHVRQVTPSRCAVNACLL